MGLLDKLKEQGRRKKEEQDKTESAWLQQQAAAQENCRKVHDIIYPKVSDYLARLKKEMGFHHFQISGRYQQLFSLEYFSKDVQYSIEFAVDSEGITAKSPRGKIWRVIPEEVDDKQIEDYLETLLKELKSAGIKID